MSLNKYSDVEYISLRDKMNITPIRVSEEPILGDGLLNKLKTGKDIATIIKSSFVAEKFPGEKHAISYELEPGKKIPHSFTGPGTNLDKRLNSDGTPKDFSKPVSALDQNSYLHDRAYQTIKKAYESGAVNNTTKKKMIHNADEKFIEMNKNIKNNKEPILTGVANKLIGLKMKAEKGKGGISLPTQILSGFGQKKEIIQIDDIKNEEDEKLPDPVEKLKKLAIKKMKKSEEKKSDMKVQKKEVKGGFAFAPILIPIISSLAGAALNKVIDKISGNGGPKISKKLTLAKKRELVKNELEKL
jgi:hypothetical protein